MGKERMDHQFWRGFQADYKRFETIEVIIMLYKPNQDMTLIVGEMIFMDYRASLKPTVDTSYIDALGRPLLQVAGYKTFM